MLVVVRYEVINLDLIYFEVATMSNYCKQFPLQLHPEMEPCYSVDVLMLEIITVQLNRKEIHWSGSKEVNWIKIIKIEIKTLFKAHFCRYSSDISSYREFERVRDLEEPSFPYFSLTASSESSPSSSLRGAHFQVNQRLPLFRSVAPLDRISFEESHGEIC